MPCLDVRNIDISYKTYRCPQLSAARCESHVKLRSLHLSRCHLPSPSILASRQLQQLTVIDTSWSGGWTAAAAAWPDLRELTWKFDTRLIDNNISSSIKTAQLTNCFAALGIRSVGPFLEATWHDTPLNLALFTRLRSLTVTEAPPVCPEFIQQVGLCLKQLHYIKIEVGRHHIGYLESDVKEGQWKLQQRLPWASVQVCDR